MQECRTIEKLILLIILLLNVSVVRAEEEVDNNYVVASLLVAQQGDMLYSCAGHAFLRMECPSLHLDYCFSYEGEPVRNQVARFIAGKLKMGMFAVKTDDFLEQYKKAGRGVKAYRLNLPLETKKRMWQRLDEMYSEGVRLPYDYVKRGCAISCKNIVENSLSPNHFISYTEWPDHFSKTRGEILGECLEDNYPWNKFFLYSIAGSEAWKDVDKDEKLIVPEDLISVWQKATVDGEAIIKDAPCELVPWNSQETEKTVITPLLLSLLFLVICLAASIFEWSLMKCIAFILQTAIGIVLTYIFFVSDLPNTDWTWLLVPFNPLPLLFCKYIKRLSPIYSIVLLVWLLGIAAYPVKMVDYSYYILCVSLLVILNINFIQETVDFMRKLVFRKVLLLFAFVSLAVLPVYAGGHEAYYYWFHNHLSAYPTGKGLVYGTENPDISSSSDLTEEDWKDEMTCKYYGMDRNIEFYAFAKPAPGYQTVGWYSADNGVPGEFLDKNHFRSYVNSFGEGIIDPESEIDTSFVVFNSFLLSYILDCTSSEDDLNEYYSSEPNNELMAVFGKVGIDMQLDSMFDVNLYDTIPQEEDNLSILADFLFFSDQWIKLKPYISKPANDVGDRIELGLTNQSYSRESYGTKDTVVVREDWVERNDTMFVPEIVGYDTIYWDEDRTHFELDPIFENIMVIIPNSEAVTVLDTIQVYDYDNPIVIHCDFTYWSNNKGEKFYDPVINVDVTELDTYVSHIAVYYTSGDKGEEDSIENVYEACPQDKIYTLQGTLVNKNGGDSLKSGMYVIGGKKVFVK